MSALLVDDLYVPVPTRPQTGRWKHVDGAPSARPQLTALPGGRPLGVAAPQARQVAPAARPAPAEAPVATGWRLTDRGLAVVVIFFLAVVATAAVVLVTSFFAVSDAPFTTAGAHQAPPVAAAVTRG